LALASGLTAFPPSFPGAAFCGLCFYKDLSSSDTAAATDPMISPARCQTSPTGATTTDHHHHHHHHHQHLSTNSNDSTPPDSSQLQKELSEQTV